MSDDKTDASVLAYYQNKKFNPVLIPIEEDKLIWEDHLKKRQNLYERHLGIPLSLLKNKSVIEFGCNSGENALILGKFGANLTLVEPNEQVLPRLSSLFEKFGLSHSIKNLIHSSVDKVELNEKFDVAIAEGFLYTLDRRDEMLKKIIDTLAPGGIGIISFVDRYGSLLEFIKRFSLWHACRLSKVDPFGDEALRLAKMLFEEEYNKLNYSRPLALWMKDMLLNPFINMGRSWSYIELLKIIENENCGFLACSPKWNLTDHFQWYKNARGVRDLHKELLNEWRASLPYIITGLPPKKLGGPFASDRVMNSLYKLVENLSNCATETPGPITIESLQYPPELSEYFDGLQDPVMTQINGELKRFFEIIKHTDPDKFIAGYRSLNHVRSLWGMSYHYFSFIKLNPS